MLVGGRVGRYSQGWSLHVWSFFFFFFFHYYYFYIPIKSACIYIDTCFGRSCFCRSLQSSSRVSVLIRFPALPRAPSTWLAEAGLLRFTAVFSELTGSCSSDSPLGRLGSSRREGEGGDQDAPVSLEPSAWEPTPDTRERAISDIPLCPDTPPLARAENQLGSCGGT